MRRPLCVALLSSQVLWLGCAMDVDTGGAAEALNEHQQRVFQCDASPVLATIRRPADRRRFKRGCHLFFEETFDGNGRVCSTCHLDVLGNGDPSDNNFDFSPEDAQRIHAEDPTDPLFRPIDSDDGAGADYTTLLAHGLVRLPFVLPPNVTVDEHDSLVDVDPETGRARVKVLRSTPSSENTGLEELLMWDGRFGSDLPLQAKEAVITHYQPGRLPTDEEAGDLAFFQQQLFTNRAVRRFARGGEPPSLPEVPEGSEWDSARRGRNFFVSMPVVPGAPVRGGHCATCHSGPMLDTTNEFNPVQEAGATFTNNFVSETNGINPAFPPGSRVGIELPEHTYHITLDHDVFMPEGMPPLFPIPPGALLFPEGTVFTLRSSDPGRILTTGDPCEFVAACLINSDPASGRFGTVSFFRTSSLWGSADTAPYFHDNSAESLEEVLEVYQTLFLVTAFGTQNPAWILAPQEVEDIIAYMRFAFPRHRELLP